MTSDRPPTDQPSPRARRWLAVWAFLLVTLFLATGVNLVHSLRANQQASAVRHAARLDPEADEPGLTAADHSLPTDARPVQVTAGIYIDRVAELSVKEVSWTVELYLWFRWRGDSPKSCEDFQVVDGSVEKKDKDSG